MSRGGWLGRKSRICTWEVGDEREQSTAHTTRDIYRDVAKYASGLVFFSGCLFFKRATAPGKARSQQRVFASGAFSPGRGRTSVSDRMVVLHRAYSGQRARGKIQQYGFEFVIFQALRSDIPPFYAAHFAISDLSRGQFHYDQRKQLEPDAVIPNGTSSQGINVGIGDWHIQGLNGRDQLQANMQNYVIKLNLQGSKPATLHNGNGIIPFGQSGFSYYYSRTRMTVSGRIIDHNQAVAVSGQAWMDHQWGNFLTSGGGGWDWYSLQLNNQREMMLYFMRDASGKAISTYVSYIDQSGKDFLLPASAIQSSVLERWTSPVTGITYPSGWRLVINDPHIRDHADHYASA